MGIHSGVRSNADVHTANSRVNGLKEILISRSEENIEVYIPITRKDGARYFWLRVRGDSMNAVGISENDEILVREQPEVENGQLAVVMVNGDEATVKYFRQEGSLVVLTPKSFNPVHQPQIYDLKRVQVRVVGLVVECRKVCLLYTSPSPRDS